MVYTIQPSILRLVIGGRQTTVVEIRREEISRPALMESAHAHTVAPHASLLISDAHEFHYYYNKSIEEEGNRGRTEEK